MQDVAQTVIQLFWLLGQLLVETLWLALRWALPIAWVAWWLWAVNWRKLWPTLAQGAWAPPVLLALVVALVWASLQPGPFVLYSAADGASWLIPNYWWQLGGVLLLFALALLCGWLQGVFGWYPPEIELAPAPTQGHEHHPEHVPHQHSPGHHHGHH